MWFFVLIGVVLVVAFIAIIAAMIKVSKNTKEQKNAPEVVTNAKVLKAYSQSHEMQTVDSANAQTTSSYYIEFLLDDKSKKKFKVKKKVFLKVHDGNYGRLTFKGYKLLDFVVIENKAISSSKNKTKYFFQKGAKDGITVKFYADAPSLNVSIPSSAPVECDYDEVCNYIKRLPSSCDNFFCLEKTNGDIIEFSNDGKSTIIEINMPLEDGYSYEGKVHSFEELERCVKDFFDGFDLASKYYLQLQQ